MARTFNWENYVDPKLAEEIKNAEGLKYDLAEVENKMTPSEKQRALEAISYSARMSEGHKAVVKKYRALEKRNNEILELYRNESSKRKAEQLLKEYNQNRASMAELRDAASYFAAEHKRISKDADYYDGLITQKLVELGKMQAPNNKKYKVVETESVKRRESRSGMKKIQ